MLSNERQARILAEDSLKAEAKLRQAAEEETCMWQDKAVALKHQAAELENEIARLRAENEKLKKEMTSVN
jgi:predicted  nucleic acid-binding Zn-ribbon protein